MSTKNVIFSNPGDVIDFVKIVEKYPFDMDMKRGRYIVDAKSLLGLMNLGFDQKIELKVYDEECDDLWKELDKFVCDHTIPCPECGDREHFRHIRSKEKGWNFWGCKACGTTFADEHGRPGAKQEKEKTRSEETDFKCPKCGKPLVARPTKSGGVWFGCSGFPKCKVRFWAKDDGTPDFENPPKN